MGRTATVERKTSETDIALTMGLDGTGKGAIDTTVPFFDHMLQLLARHGEVDLSLKARGDTQVDDHHLVEDTGICLGEALHQALGDKRGIYRFGWALVPMDECLCRVAIDLSGRPVLVFHAPPLSGRIGGFDAGLVREFFKSFSDHGRMALHMEILYGTNLHHMAEALFKAFAVALRKAVAMRRRSRGIPSTKGAL